MNSTNFKVKAITGILIIVPLWVISVVAALQILGKLPQPTTSQNKILQDQKVVNEESLVIDVVNKVSPSVVSIAVENRQLFDPFGNSVGSKKGESGIGTGFVVS